MRLHLAFCFTSLFLCASAWGQSGPASSPATGAGAKVDLSSPKAALLAAYQALKAGDLEGTKQCLVFKDGGEAELFEITFSQLYMPLKLMHALEGKFGAGARQLFANAPLERALDATVAEIPAVEIHVEGDAAAVVDKKAEINPSAENQLTGISFRKENGQWKIVAGTFTDVADTGTMPAAELALMRKMRDAIEAACGATAGRLEKGDFKTAEEAFADYQGRVQAALQMALPAATGSAPAAATQK